MPRTQTLINSISVSDCPSTLRKKFEYSAGLVIYAGSAPKGTATSDVNWTINKYTYDGSSQVTDITTAFDSWDNRAGATYE